MRRALQPGEPAVVGLGAAAWRAGRGVPLDVVPAHRGVPGRRPGDQVGDDGCRRDRLVGQARRERSRRARARSPPGRAAGRTWVRWPGTRLRQRAPGRGTGGSRGPTCRTASPVAARAVMLPLWAAWYRLGGSRRGVEPGGGHEPVEFPVAVGRLDGDDRRPAAGQAAGDLGDDAGRVERVVEAERRDDQVAGPVRRAGAGGSPRGRRCPPRAAGSRFRAVVSSAADRSIAAIRAQREPARRACSVVVPRPHPMSAMTAAGPGWPRRRGRR